MARNPGAAAGPSRRARPDERLGALHPAAGGDDAADGRHPAGRLVAYRFLPLSALPEVDYPTIQVQTFYPGASPEVMTSSVTAPLERQFGQMPGLNADDVDELRPAPRSSRCSST